MKVGIYGGSFDPIHNGHLITASMVAELRGLDKIIFIPNWVSPLKTEQKPRAGRLRLDMVRLAIEGSSLFEVSDIEISKPAVSYTIDTVKALLPAYPRMELIIGYDNLVVFDKWKEPDELMSLVTVVVLNRRAAEYSGPKNAYFDKAVMVQTPEIEISSTDIRQRIDEGRSIDYLVPAAVKNYIIKNQLYVNKPEQN